MLPCMCDWKTAFWIFILQVPLLDLGRRVACCQKSSLWSPLVSIVKKSWLGSLQFLGSFATPLSHGQQGAGAMALSKTEASRNCIEITLMYALASHQHPLPAERAYIIHWFCSRIFNRVVQTSWRKGQAGGGLKQSDSCHRRLPSGPTVGFDGREQSDASLSLYPRRRPLFSHK